MSFTCSLDKVIRLALFSGLDLVILSLFFLSISSNADPCKYTGEPNSANVIRPHNDFSYHTDLLKAIIRVTQKEYGEGQIVTYKKYIPTKRVAEKVEKGKRINVFWAPATNIHEKKDIIPVKIPLYKGGFGLRLALIRKSDQDIFKGIKTVDQLKMFRVAQGLGWDDVIVYKHHGFEVILPHKQHLLLTMLERKRFDFAPLSAN